MLEKYNKYCDQMNVVLDLWCKLELIELVLYDKLNSSKVISYVKSIWKNLAKWFEEMTKFSNKRNLTSASHQETALSHKTQVRAEEKEKEQYKKFLAENNTVVAGSKLAELNLYLQEPTVPIDALHFSILDWWKINKSWRIWFPTLAILAKTILMVPMTSIASESAFSTGGQVLSNHRTRMKPTTLKALVCGQDWIHSKEGLYPPENEEIFEDGDAAEVVVIS
jgi:oligoribonuclease (3'-5' exoribonuclease)